MSYFLGIDLGTTYTAAATSTGKRARIASLGPRAATIPSVVLLREDGEVLVGEAAERRAIMEPHRIAREFKRRVGDPTPLIVGGTPYSADALTAKLLRHVVDRVTDDEGEPPAGIAVCHPANWGNYKQDLLSQAIRRADLDDVAIVSEPEAAAIHYAAEERVEPGSVIAVYDLGGGTFDAAVLRRTDDSWEILGRPEGVERLGGVDFDEAVFQHVIGTVLPTFDQVDTDDPPTVTAVARLRQECIHAKEALTVDTPVSIPVLLPSVQTDVRLTRGELEDMIRPSLLDTVAALRRALKSAGVAAEDIATVLLVGGSSRIPLVAELVESELGRPVALDAHPKHSVALGAARVAADRGPVAVPADAQAGAAAAVAAGAGAGSAARAGAGAAAGAGSATGAGAGARIITPAGGPGAVSAANGPAAATNVASATTGAAAATHPGSAAAATNGTDEATTAAGGADAAPVAGDEPAAETVVQEPAGEVAADDPTLVEATLIARPEDLGLPADEVLPPAERHATSNLTGAGSAAGGSATDTPVRDAPAISGPATGGRAAGSTTAGSATDDSVTPDGSTAAGSATQGSATVDRPTADGSTAAASATHGSATADGSTAGSSVTGDRRTADGSTAAGSATHGSATTDRSAPDGSTGDSGANGSAVDNRAAGRGSGEELAVGELGQEAPADGGQDGGRAPTPPEGAVHTPPAPQAEVGTLNQSPEAAASAPASVFGPQPQMTGPVRPRRAPRSQGSTRSQLSQGTIALIVGSAVAAILLVVVVLVALRTDSAEGRRAPDTASDTPSALTPGDGDSGEDGSSENDGDSDDDVADASSSTTAPRSESTSTTRRGPSTTEQQTGTTEASTTTSEATTTSTEATTTSTEATTTTTTEPTTSSSTPPAGGGA